jgi:hypothetical protein
MKVAELPELFGGQLIQTRRQINSFHYLQGNCLAQAVSKMMSANTAQIPQSLNISP